MVRIKLYKKNVFSFPQDFFQLKAKVIMLMSKKYQITLNTTNIFHPPNGKCARC
jgi:hypothetical protein